MEEVVSPVFHKYETPPEAEMVTLFPGQILDFVAVIVGDGSVPEEEIVTGELTVQARESVIPSV